MTERAREGILFLALSLTLSLFLVGHCLVVEVEFEACFENLAASVNGERPYRRVVVMGFGELAASAIRQLSADHLLVAVSGLFPLSPFLVAWLLSRSRQTRRFWIAAALAALLSIVAWTATRTLADFYDCDLNGVSLSIVLAPLLYAAISLLATLGLAFLRYLTLVPGE